MALTHQYFFLEVDIVDSAGDSTKRTYRLTAATMAAAITDSATIMTALNAVTDGVIKSYRIGDLYAESALSLPLAGVQIENEALLTVGIVGKPTKSATLSIPAPKGSVFTTLQGPGSNLVNTADPDVAAYMALFATAGQATLSDGEVADPLYGFKGVRRHKKSLKG